MSQEAPGVCEILKIPFYCNHSKFFLVEELALQETYQKLHFGRCCVIGKTATDITDCTSHYIENIRLPSLPNEFSLPEGTVRLLLIAKHLRRAIPNGKICEIIGETVLYDTADKTANKVLLTSKDVVEKLNYLRSKKTSEREYETFLLNRYQPAIAVDDIKVLERGLELAERNLEIRMLLNS